MAQTACQRKKGRTKRPELLWGAWRKEVVKQILIISTTKSRISHSHSTNWLTRTRQNYPNVRFSYSSHTHEIIARQSLYIAEHGFSWMNHGFIMDDVMGDFSWTKKHSHGNLLKFHYHGWIFENGRVWGTYEEQNSKPRGPIRSDVW